MKNNDLTVIIIAIKKYLERDVMDRDELVIPKHIAIIMDGNGRWAKKRGKIRLEGHRAGANSLEKILRHAGNIGVKYLTVYAFSTENWKRPEKEVNGLMDLFAKYLDREKKTLKKQGVKLLVTGAKENISEKLLKKIEETENYLANCENIVFNIAFNYGGRREIVDAVNKVLETKLLNETSGVASEQFNNENNGLNVTEKVVNGFANKKENLKITEEEFSKFMYRPEIPDPELVIRTSGEFRISNFLLWEVAYSEFYITDVYWPDFDEKELDKAILSFNKRDRRYGGLNVK